MKKRKYSAEMPRELYIFFKNYAGEGAPSFTKFAKMKGLTTAELDSFRRFREFERAYLECIELRRDFIIDRALSRKFDSSFSKMIITDDLLANEDKRIEFCLKVEQ